MRTLSRLLLAGVAVILVAAALATFLPWQQGDSAGLLGSDEGNDASAGRITVLPQISQPGNTTAKAQAASAVVSVDYPANAAAAIIILEQQTGAGWRIVDSAAASRSGKASFPLPAARIPRRQWPLRATVLNERGAVTARTDTASPAQWQLAFEDQFAGRDLTPRRWTHRMLGRYNEFGSRACSMSDQSAVAVRQGVLALQARLDPDRRGESCATKHGTFSYMLNGHVSTEETYDFTHGVAAARIRFPQGRGQHGAFWLQRHGDVTPQPGNPAVSGAEIDVVEFFGEGYPAGGLASFLYYLNEAGENEKVGGVWPQATRQLPPGDAWWRSYHVFSVEWTPKQYVFRVDGRETFRTKEGVSGVPQYLILSLLTSDWELPQLNERSLPTTMEVDWVRVWQQQ